MSDGLGEDSAGSLSEAGEPPGVPRGGSRESPFTSQL